ncbi:MAG: anti-sigma factor [Ardenticatenaceae bacterium]|nr:anti-sigma factor [Ardenticatenaceae bacterium]
MMDQPTDCSVVQELLAIYALGALPAGECRPVVEHVAHCARCAAELSDYQAVTEALAESVPLVEAPPELEARLRLAMAQQPAAAPRAGRWSQERIWRAAAGFALAALAVLVLFLGGLTLRLNRELVQTRAELDRLTLALAASDSTPVPVMGEPGQVPLAHGQFIYAEHSHDGVLVVRDLPPLPDDRVYQLWLVRKDGGRDNGGLFRPDERGQAWLTVQASRPWSEYKAMGVTVEPPGGSPGPTGPRALHGDL